MGVLPTIVVALAPGLVAAQAQQRTEDDYVLEVDGLACPFCAYGLERKLEALPGVGEVAIDLAGARVSFDVEDRPPLLPERVDRAVREAGFELRSLQMRVRGRVDGSGDSLRLRFGDELLPLRGGRAFAELGRRVAEGMRDVVVVGRAHERGERWVLEVVEVHRPAQPPDR